MIIFAVKFLNEDDWKNISNDELKPFIIIFFWLFSNKILNPNLSQIKLPRGDFVARVKFKPGV
jgi:hypothetical protein